MADVRERIAKLQATYDNATYGRWDAEMDSVFRWHVTALAGFSTLGEHRESIIGPITSDNADVDAAAIVASRNALPSLLNIAAVMQQEVEDCPVCGGTGTEPQWRHSFSPPQVCVACETFRVVLARFVEEAR